MTDTTAFVAVASGIEFVIILGLAYAKDPKRLAGEVASAIGWAERLQRENDALARQLAQVKAGLQAEQAQTARHQHAATGCQVQLSATAEQLEACRAELAVVSAELAAIKADDERIVRELTDRTRVELAALEDQRQRLLQEAP